jgi:hypothetical protein
MPPFVGRRLAAIRAELDLTQQQLGTAIGRSQAPAAARHSGINLDIDSGIGVGAMMLVDNRVAEMLTSNRCGPLFLRQPNSYCIRSEVRSRAKSCREQVQQTAGCGSGRTYGQAASSGVGCLSEHGQSVNTSCTEVWNAPPFIGPPPATWTPSLNTAAPMPWRGVGIGA